jgi:hypothetical protein
VISISELRTHVVDKWVAFDVDGTVLDVEIPRDIGPAALFVSPVTDALKEVDENGRVVGSVDRSLMWSVETIVLNEVALRRLEGRLSAGELIDAVRTSGLAWAVRPISDP